jgi:uncharacterized protein YjbJ (UPF0337 family)
MEHQTVSQYGRIATTYQRRFKVMNWDQIEGNWKQMKGSVQEKWGKLTDDDLTVAKGRLEEVAGRIQERYGVSREEAEKQLADFVKAQKAG